MSSSKKLEFDVEIEAPSHLFYDAMANKPHSFNTLLTIFKTAPSNLIWKSESGKDGTALSLEHNHGGKKRTVKNIIEKKDDEKNLSITWKVIDGYLLGEYKSFKVGMEASPRGTGSLVRWSFEYENKAGFRDPQSLREFFLHNTKIVDAYLINAQLNHAWSCPYHV